MQMFSKPQSSRITEQWSYIKDILLEYSMEHDADQSIEEDRKQIFDSIAIQCSLSHAIDYTQFHNPVQSHVLSLIQ